MTAHLFWSASFKPTKESSSYNLHGTTTKFVWIKEFFFFFFSKKEAIEGGSSSSHYKESTSGSSRRVSKRNLCDGGLLDDDGGTLTTVEWTRLDSVRTDTDDHAATPRRTLHSPERYFDDSVERRSRTFRVMIKESQVERLMTSFV